jgi:copper chaperone CopZ
MGFADNDGEVEVEIDKKTGEVEVRGEGRKAKDLKDALEGLGEVTERHIGHEHQHETDEDHDHTYA